MFKKKQTPTRRNVQTGPSANVFSYHSSRSGSDVGRGRYEPPASHRRGLERLKHIPTALALVVIVGSLVYASLLDTKPRIMISASSTGKPLQRPTNVYEDHVEKLLQGSVFNRSKLTFDTRPIVEGLQKEFPEVANAVITIPIVGQRPVVHIAVSSPAFILGTTSGAYYISADGKPLVRVTDVENQLPDIATVNDETSLPITIGKQVLPVSTVSFITGVIKQMHATNTPIQSITLPLEANELQVRIIDQPYLVRLNTLNDPRVQMGTLLAVKKKLEGSREVPKEYIDVRVEERAYYK